MRLLDRTKEAQDRVANARLDVDLALLKMAEVLDEVQRTAERAKEEIHERRTSE